MIIKMKKESGITLVALVITVIILLIIASISVYEGTDAIKNAKIQTIDTNMLTIKAKAKAYGEEIDAAIWALSDEDKSRKKDELIKEYGMSATTINNSNIISQLDSEVSSDYDVYEISQMLKNIGLNDTQDSSSSSQYLVVYNSSDYTKMDIVYTTGVTYNGTKYYTLSALQQIYDEDLESID
jgi:type II secretory pathway pseudopilin PulG